MYPPELQLSIHSVNGESQLNLTLSNLVCLGWSARDRNQLEGHVRELAKLGIRGPKEIPEVFIVAPELARTDSSVKVEHEETSGEVEYVLVMSNQNVYVTVGSDHTDRKLEAKDILRSKQKYPKVLCKDVWPFEEVRDHWDRIILRSWCGDETSKLDKYQEATLSQLLTPDDALRNFKSAIPRAGDSILFSGTITTVGGQLNFSGIFAMEMEDPVMKRFLRCRYVVLQQ